MRFVPAPWPKYGVHESSLLVQAKANTHHTGRSLQGKGSSKQHAARSSLQAILETCDKWMLTCLCTDVDIHYIKSGNLFSSPSARRAKAELERVFKAPPVSNGWWLGSWIPCSRGFTNIA